MTSPKNGLAQNFDSFLGKWGVFWKKWTFISKSDVRTKERPKGPFFHDCSQKPNE